MRDTTASQGGKRGLKLELPEAVDGPLRLLFTILFLVWNTLEGAVFENEYPMAFVKLYPYPIWRFVLLVALITGALWCPSIGVMLAFTAFFYVMDMEVTMDKWV